MSRASKRLEKPYSRIQRIRERDQEKQKDNSITTSLSDSTEDVLSAAPHPDVTYVSTPNHRTSHTTCFTYTTNSITIDNIAESNNITSATVNAYYIDTTDLSLHYSVDSTYYSMTTTELLTGRTSPAIDPYEEDLPDEDF